jgi:hypothetical protein
MQNSSAVLSFFFIFGGVSLLAVGSLRCGARLSAWYAAALRTSLRSPLHIAYATILLLASSGTFAQAPLFPIFRNGQCTYLDSKGNPVLDIKHAIDYAQPFTEGLAPARLAETQLIGYLNTQGEWAIPPTLTCAGAFNQGLAVVCTPCDEHCLTNAEGLMLFNYTKVIDKKGNIVLHDNSQDSTVYKRFWFDNYNEQGMLRVVHGLSVGDIKTMMNRQGEMVGERSGMCCLEVSDGLIAYNTYEGHYYTDKTGEVVLHAGKYTAIQPFSEGVAWVSTDQDYVLINKKGKELLKLSLEKYSFPSLFGEGLSSVLYNERYQYINQKGKTVIEGDYVTAEPFSNGFAHIEDGDFNDFYINKKGEKVIPFPSENSYSDLEFGKFQPEGYAFVYSYSEIDGSLQAIAMVLQDGRTFFVQEED